MSDIKNNKKQVKTIRVLVLSTKHYLHNLSTISIPFQCLSL